MSTNSPSSLLEKVMSLSDSDWSLPETPSEYDLASVSTSEVESSEYETDKLDDDDDDDDDDDNDNDKPEFSNVYSDTDGVETSASTSTGKLSTPYQSFLKAKKNVNDVHSNKSTFTQAQVKDYDDFNRGSHVIQPRLFYHNHPTVDCDGDVSSTDSASDSEIDVLSKNLKNVTLLESGKSSSRITHEFEDFDDNATEVGTTTDIGADTELELEHSMHATVSKIQVPTGFDYENLIVILKQNQDKLRDKILKKQLSMIAIRSACGGRLFLRSLNKETVKLVFAQIPDFIGLTGKPNITALSLLGHILIWKYSELMKKKGLEAEIIQGKIFQLIGGEHLWSDNFEKGEKMSKVKFGILTESREKFHLNEKQFKKIIKLFYCK